MDTKKIKNTIRRQVTVERVAIAVGAVVTYTYVMGRLDYRMVRPSHATETHVIFDRPLGGTTAVRIAE